MERFRNGEAFLSSLDGVWSAAAGSYVTFPKEACVADTGKLDKLAQSDLENDFTGESVKAYITGGARRVPTC